MSARLTVYPAAARQEARKTTVGARTLTARRIAADARLAAPVLKGDYRAGIAVRVAGSNVIVENADDTAKFKEYGTSRTPAHAAMTNSARRYGEYTGWQPR